MIVLAGASNADAHGKGNAAPEFVRRATYPVYLNLPIDEQGEQTVSEISAVSKDGRTLIYTDALGQRIGFLDISNPKKPVGKGTLDVTTLAGLDHASPTSVEVVGRYVLVVVDQTPAPADEQSETFDSQARCVSSTWSRANWFAASTSAVSLTPSRSARTAGTR